MCIATVYVDDAGELKKAMEDVVSVNCDNRGVLLTNILGDEMLLSAAIEHIDFLKHSVTVKSSPSGRKVISGHN